MANLMSLDHYCGLTLLPYSNLPMMELFIINVVNYTDRMTPKVGEMYIFLSLFDWFSQGYGNDVQLSLYTDDQ